MKSKVDAALEKLNHVLPLSENLKQCNSDVQFLYKKILSSFVESGCILPKEEFSNYVDDVEGAIQVLTEKKLIVLSDEGLPLGAYPFTMDDREFKVSVNNFKVNAMCALDSLAVGPMYNLNTVITSVCRITGEDIRVEQLSNKILNEDVAGDIFVAIDWGQSKSDIECANSLCMSMFFINNINDAKVWQSDSEQTRDIFTLEESVEFASRFFCPLITSTS